MIRPASAFAPMLAVLGCAGSTAAPALGFEQRTLELCDPETRGVPIHTGVGGYLLIEVIDLCGMALERCQSPDFFAAGATATLRVAGTDILLEGCAMPASGGSRLRASFVAEGSTTAVESYEVTLVAECLPVPRACGTDAGPPPRDGGVPLDAPAPSDAGGAADAGGLLDGS